MNGQNSAQADNARRTPTWLLDAARELMGGIDLDPASDTEAQMSVQAHTCYGPGCVVQNGLSVPWAGRVWLNPPGGYLPETRMSSAGAWWGYLLEQYLRGRVDQALFLAFSLNVFRTAQYWGAAPYEFPFLVFKDRIRFPGSKPGDKGESPNVDSALVYLPPRTGTDTALAKFALIFGAFGKVRI